MLEAAGTKGMKTFPAFVELCFNVPFLIPDAPRAVCCN